MSFRKSSPVAPGAGVTPPPMTDASEFDLRSELARMKDLLQQSQQEVHALQRSLQASQASHIPGSMAFAPKDVTGFVLSPRSTPQPRPRKGPGLASTVETPRLASTDGGSEALLGLIGDL